EIVFFSLPTPHHPPKKSPTLKSIDFPSLVLLLVSSPLPSLSLSSLLLPSYKNTRRRSRGELGGLKLATVPPSLGKNRCRLLPLSLFYLRVLLFLSICGV
ncbi:hypothetical protein Tsubulata_029117, partial [Turnera subulata]